MKHTFPLTENGDVESLLVASLSGRRLQLGEEEAHIFQSLAASWRLTARAFSVALDGVEAAETADGKAEGALTTGLAEPFRQLFYAATETLDLYAQLLPRQLGSGRVKAEARSIDAFRNSCRLRRSVAAEPCNALKHGGRQLIFGRMRSIEGPDRCIVMGIAKYKGQGLEPDPRFHPTTALLFMPPEIARLLHLLLRLDANAAELVHRLKDNAEQAQPAHTAVLKLADVLTRLCGHEVYTATPAPNVFDGLQLSNRCIELVRMHGRRIAEPSRRSTVITADGFTQSYPFF